MDASAIDDRLEQQKQGSVPVPGAMLPHLGECALLFDIDGTLIDLAPTPDGIHVPPELPGQLHELWRLTSGALALVSGRMIDEIDQIMKPIKLPAVGGHGVQMRPFADAEVQSAVVKPLDPHLKKRFAALGSLSPGILIEDKGYSIAVHYRLAPHLGHEVRDEVSAVCARFSSTKLEILPGKSVVEVKQPSFNKGTAVRELMQHAPFKGRKPIFIGDDVTDEAAFEVMPEFAGIGFSVGREVQGIAGTFETPGDVRRWIAEMVRGGQEKR